MYKTLNEFFNSLENQISKNGKIYFNLNDLNYWKNAIENEIYLNERKIKRGF